MHLPLTHSVPPETNLFIKKISEEKKENCNSRIKQFESLKRICEKQMAKKSFSHLYTEGFFSEALQTQRFSVLRNFREIEKEIERNVSFPPLLTKHQN